MQGADDEGVEGDEGGQFVGIEARRGVLQGLRHGDVVVDSEAGGVALFARDG